MEQKLSEQELVRRQKMEDLRAKGIDPFGHAFARTHRSAQLREESEVRDGTSEDTLATPEDFPEAYDYGSGLLNGWNYHDMYRRLPEPEGNQTVLNTNPDAGGFQALYLWERGNVPARTEFTEDMTGY